MPEMAYGRAVAISPQVRRIVAPNPGPMTGQGTNTYLLGREQVAVVDPGPAADSHVAAILEAAAQRIRWIIVTHTHPDHSPAAQALKQETGALMMGNTIPDDGFQDTSFASEHSFEHGEVFSTPEFSLRALHTPGHVSNHFCFLVQEDGVLMTGDHLMNGSTVVIIPPHGNMADYISSLRLLLDYPVRLLAPGHGDVMEHPVQVIEWVLQHRLERENKVLQALEQAGEADLDALLPRVYADVDTSLHGVARFSLWAHLLKLQDEGRAAEDKGLWRIHTGGD